MGSGKHGSSGDEAVGKRRGIEHVAGSRRTDRGRAVRGIPGRVCSWLHGKRIRSGPEELQQIVREADDPPPPDWPR